MFPINVTCSNTRTLRFITRSVVVSTTSSSSSGDDTASTQESTVETPTSSTLVPSSSDPYYSGNEVICGVEDMHAFLIELLDIPDVPLPNVEEGGRTRYVSEEGRIYLDPCEPVDTLAHEAGHYVMDRANAFNLDAHFADALENFCPGGAVDGRCVDGWIVAQEWKPGVEHAAHCIGNALIDVAAYAANCPVIAMRDIARERIETARRMPAKQ